jgi:glycerophosphoryl diester phosphodiesterase
MTGNTALLFPVLGALLTIACGPDYDDVLLIGHRGSPTGAPENSLAGFELAYEQGADGVEFDVHQTRDGRNVVMHDVTVDRTTNCTGRVRDYSVEEIRTCTLSNGEPVVTLGEMLSSIDGLFEIIFLEIKVPEDPPPPDEDTVAQVEDAVAAVRASGLADKTVIISYSHVALRRIAARQADGVIGGWDDFTTESISNASRYDMPWVLMPVRTIEPWMGDIVVGLGRQLAVYQVVTVSEFVRAIDGRARAIMVDSPPTFAALLGRMPRKLPRE